MGRLQPVASFLKAPKKPEQNSHIQTRSEVLVVQEVSGLYTSPFLDTDELTAGLTGPKTFRGFRQTGPRALNLKILF